jgi:molybdopterin-binding protein
MLSARNQLKGTIKSVKLGQIMAEVVIEVAGLEVVSHKQGISGKIESQEGG